MVDAEAPWEDDWQGWIPFAEMPHNRNPERGWYDDDDPFGVTHTAAVRMVVDFGDDEKVRAVLAGGTTARTFHEHQKDQIAAYLSGEPKHWWFCDQAIQTHTISTLTPVPKR